MGAIRIARAHVKLFARLALRKGAQRTMVGRR